MLYFYTEACSCHSQLTDHAEILYVQLASIFNWAVLSPPSCNLNTTSTDYRLQSGPTKGAPTTAGRDTRNSQCQLLQVRGRGLQHLQHLPWRRNAPVFLQTKRCEAITNPCPRHLTTAGSCRPPAKSKAGLPIEVPFSKETMRHCLTKESSVLRFPVS